MSNPTQQNKTTAPYVPFKSFLTGLDYLRQGLPHVLDRSAWPTFSGGLAGQMLATFKFIGFISEDYEVTPLLERAVDPDKRKDAVKDAVFDGYAELIGMDLSRMTPKQLADILSELYNVTGATQKKAMTFFLHAAKFVDLPLSPTITRKTRSSGPRRRRTVNVGGESSSIPSPPNTERSNGSVPEQNKASGSSKTINLRGGGKATVSFDVDVWSMTPEDQKFVFGLIKAMNDYEQEKASPEESSS